MPRVAGAKGKRTIRSEQSSISVGFFGEFQATKRSDKGRVCVELMLRITEPRQRFRFQEFLIVV